MGPACWVALGSLLALGALLEGRLVGEGDAGFGECNRFFYAETPPAGLAAEGHVKICQRSEGTERFATLYSTRDRIPVYSAFRAPRPAPAGAEQRWLVEPQVSAVVPQPGRWAGFLGRLAAALRGRTGKAAPAPSVPGSGNAGFGSSPLRPGSYSPSRPCQRHRRGSAISETSPAAGGSQWEAVLSPFRRRYRSASFIS